MGLIITAFSLLCLAGSTTCAMVTQTPSDLLKKEATSAQLQCSHSHSSYNTILWYKQTMGGGLQLLGYLVGPSDTPEEEFKNKIKLSGNAMVNENATIVIEKLVPMDTAVYFCAASRGNEAYFGAGTKLTVLDPQKEIRGPVVEVLPPSEAELCKKKKKDNVTLLCVAKNFYPDHVYVSWEIDNDVKREKTKDVPIEKDGNYIISSRLRVPKKDWKSGKKFTCIVYYYNGTGYEPFQDSISGVKGHDSDDEGFTLQRALTAKLAYAIFVAKSFFYGFFILILVKKRASAEKR